ncbi:MAG: hypothetical protein J07HX5_00757 [halophilic archaeon J07HX5]|jgi:hypothetical protein|nr:MAG: hypothetical protein J07HX5_00757 [halophilic archaeon J07HX5]
MYRLPFGISRLDEMVAGGAPAGSVVLLSGEAGAGAREFMQTVAVMNGLAVTDHELFKRHYGCLATDTRLPETISYLTVTADPAAVRSEIGLWMNTTLAEAGLERVRLCSVASAVFRDSRVPQHWYDDSEATRNDDPSGEPTELLAALCRRLTNYAPNGLVIIDSLSDLVAAAAGIDWSEISVLLHGLRTAAHRWGSLLLVRVSPDTLVPTEHGRLVDACSATITFEWTTNGSTRARTFVIQAFRGVLSGLPAERLVRFETDLSETGFHISDVRKIR